MSGSSGARISVLPSAHPVSLRPLSHSYWLSISWVSWSRQHLFPAPWSAVSCRQLKIGRVGSIYTSEITKYYKLGPAPNPIPHLMQGQSGQKIEKGEVRRKSQRCDQAANWRGTPKATWGRQDNGPNDVPILTPRTCEYVSLHGKRDFADGIQLTVLRIGWIIRGPGT